MEGTNKEILLVIYRTIWNTISKSTCYIEGSIELVCSVCGNVLDTGKILCKHCRTEWFNEKISDCINSGKKVLKCVDCGKEYARVSVHKLGHEYSDFRCIRCDSLTYVDDRSGIVISTQDTCEMLGIRRKDVVVIPETVNYYGEDYRVAGLGSSVFYNCSNITSAVMTDSITYGVVRLLWSCVEKFRGLAFSGISFTGIPKSLVSIAPDQVSAVNSLHKCFGTTINVDESNTRYYVTAN